jgi:hypothetical protein
VVITLTPHIIRVLDVTEEDLRAFQVGGSGAATGFDLTLPIPGALAPPDPAQQPPINPGQPVPDQPQPGQPQQQPGEIPPATPIFPPAPPPPPPTGR